MSLCGCGHHLSSHDSTGCAVAIQPRGVAGQMLVACGCSVKISECTCDPNQCDTDDCRDERCWTSTARHASASTKGNHD